MFKPIIGFAALMLPLTVAAQTRPDTTRLRLDSVQSLQEVNISSNMLKVIKEAPGNVTVVDTRPFYNSNVSPIQLLKQTSGIKVRQDGGYGSRAEFFINGSTGRQLKFFLDGMPIDNNGETMGINTIPLEQIERIEIYKGILPPELGTDALGGAINIILRKDKLDYLDASYAISSFSTHKLSLAMKKRLGHDWYVSLNGFRGASKNDYSITAGVPNATYNLEMREVRRFHDAYDNYIIKAETGVSGKSWADQLILTASISGLDKQLQNNLTMTQPYGQATYAEKLYNAQLRYVKNNLFKGVSLANHLSYGRVKGLTVDTSRNIYTWDGQVFDRRLKPDEGEFGKAKYLRTTNDVINEKFSFSRRIDNRTKLSLVNTLQYFYRTGRDTLSMFYNGGTDFYGKPARLLKNVAAFGYETAFLEESLRLSGSLKYFAAAMSSYELVETDHVKRSQDIGNLGWNQALTYTLRPGLLLKASFERAVRLPETEEAFGNLMLIRPNPDLRPEKSNNVNLNALFSSEVFDLELTGFYRDVTDLIYLETDVRGNGTSKNLSNARIMGAELSAMVRLIKSLKFSGNATYQDLRNRGTLQGQNNADPYFNARIPNTPYLLANAALSCQLNDLLIKGSKTSLWFNSNFTNEYFLYWANDGDREFKNRIPTQFLHNAGVSITFQNRLTFALESYNLTNEKTYDNFNVQLPGRSFSFKTRYYITK